MSSTAGVRGGSEGGKKEASMMMEVWAPTRGGAQRFDLAVVDEAGQVIQRL